MVAFWVTGLSVAEVRRCSGEMVVVVVDLGLMIVVHVAAGHGGC